MKKFALYESFNFIDDNILEHSEQNVKREKRDMTFNWKKCGVIAACFCLLVATAFTVSNLLYSSRSELLPFYASLGSGTFPNGIIKDEEGKLNGSLNDNASTGDEERVKASNAVIDKTLTLSEALDMDPFGSYMLSTVPSGYSEESIRWYEDENSSYLSALWTKGEGSFDEISWRVFSYNESDANRITSVDDTKNYDLGRYSVPLADSVPDELSQIVYRPIFKIEELTLDAVNRRAYSLNDGDDTKGTRMCFSVLYGDVVVEVTTKGVSAEWLYEQLINLDSSTGN